MTAIVELDVAGAKLPLHVFTPEGDGPFPAVILFTDAGGVRPSMHEIANRLAGDGYLVAMPDVFYRGAPYPPGGLFSLALDPARRPEFRAKYADAATKPDNAKADMQAVLTHLARRRDVKQAGVGTTGYCMGGRFSLLCAGWFPDRVVAAASFHGGGIAAEVSESPHHLAPQMRARLYVAGAIDDPTFPDEMKQRLIDAFTAAKRDFLVETYEAKHGFAVRDAPSFDAAAAERHWQAMRALFDRSLKR